MAGWIVSLIVALLRVVVPALIEAGHDKAGEAQRQPALRSRLRGRIRQRWAGAMLLLMCVGLTGCGTRSVYVPDGEPVRLRETVRSAKVWIMSPEGKPIEASVDLLEGWYCLSDEGEDMQQPDPAMIVTDPVEVSLQLPDGSTIRLLLDRGSPIVIPGGIKLRQPTESPAAGSLDA